MRQETDTIAQVVTSEEIRLATVEASIKPVNEHAERQRCSPEPIPRTRLVPLDW